MKRVLPVILMSAVLLQACTKEFTLDVSGKSKLFLHCCPGANDTTYIYLNRAVPVGDSYKGSFFLEDAEIAFEVDDVLMAMHREGYEEGIQPRRCWYVVDPLPEGGRISFSAVVDDLPPITATTVIPADVPEFEYDLSADASSLRIAFDDNPDTRDWYGIALLCEREVYDWEGKAFETVQYAWQMPKQEMASVFSVSLEKRYVDATFDGFFFGNDNRCTLRIWPDEYFSGPHVDLTVQFRNSPGLWSGNAHTYKNRYKVRLFKVTQEFFNYAVAQDHVKNNELAQGGLAPAAFAYTNIHGGVGILAGWTMRETDWITLD